MLPFIFKVIAMAVETMEVLIWSIPIILVHILVVTWMDTCRLDWRNQAAMMWGFTFTICVCNIFNISVTLVLTTCVATVQEEAEERLRAKFKVCYGLYISSVVYILQCDVYDLMITDSVYSLYRVLMIQKYGRNLRVYPIEERCWLSP